MHTFYVILPKNRQIRTLVILKREDGTCRLVYLYVIPKATNALSGEMCVISKARPRLHVVIMNHSFQFYIQIIFLHTKKPRWWTSGDSNSLPPPCKGGALPDELEAHAYAERQD